MPEWFDHLSLTYQGEGLILNKGLLMWIETSPYMSWFRRVLRFPSTRKVERVGWVSRNQREVVNVLLKINHV